MAPTQFLNSISFFLFKSKFEISQKECKSKEETSSRMKQGFIWMKENWIKSKEKDKIKKEKGKREHQNHYPNSKTSIPSIMWRKEWGKDGQSDSPTTPLYIKTKETGYNCEKETRRKSISFSESGQFQKNMEAYTESESERNCIWSLFLSSIYDIEWLSRTYHHGQLQLLGSNTFILFYVITCFQSFFFFVFFFLLIFMFFSRSAPIGTRGNSNIISNQNNSEKGSRGNKKKFSHSHVI